MSTTQSTRKKRQPLTPEQREAANAAQRRYRALHPEKALNSQAVWRAANTEEERARSAAYNAANREARRAQSAACRQSRLARWGAAFFEAHREEERARRAPYRAAHKEEKRATDAAWRRQHTDERSAARRRRRAAQRNAPVCDFTAAQWHAMQAACDHRCAYCDRRAKGHLTQDHLTPLSDGGSHTLSNILPACASCNSKKGPRKVLSPVQPLLLLAS